MFQPSLNVAVALLSGSGEKQTKNAVRRGGSRAATYDGAICDNS